jgi:hypothetical protein
VTRREIASRCDRSGRHRASDRSASSTATPAAAAPGSGTKAVLVTFASRASMHVAPVTNAIRAIEPA